MPSTSLWCLCLLFFFEPFASFRLVCQTNPNKYDLRVSYRQDLQHIRFLKERKVLQLGDRCNHPCTSWQKLEAFHQLPFFVPNCRSPKLLETSRRLTSWGQRQAPTFVVDFQRQASCERYVSESDLNSLNTSRVLMMSIGWAWKWEQSVDKRWGDVMMISSWHIGICFLSTKV